MRGSCTYVVSVLLLSGWVWVYAHVSVCCLGLQPARCMHMLC
jgi:hypothetical protein